MEKVNVIDLANILSQVTKWQKLLTISNFQAPHPGPHYAFFLFRCGMCVATGSDLSGLNVCDWTCIDDLSCLDCNDVPYGGAVYNLCGNCTSQENFFEGNGVCMLLG